MSSRFTQKIERFRAFWKTESGNNWLLTRDFAKDGTPKKLFALLGFALLGISMIEATPESKPVQFENVKDLVERWRQKLRTFLAEVVALEQAVDLISQGYFDGHDVLFDDAKEHLTSSHEIAQELITDYNWFAENNGKQRIDLDDDPGRQALSVEQRLNEWVMLSRSKALSAQGKIFEARDEVLSWLIPDK